MRVFVVRGCAVAFCVCSSGLAGRSMHTSRAPGFRSCGTCKPCGTTKPPKFRALTKRTPKRREIALRRAAKHGGRFDTWPHRCLAW
eukprot:4297296-Pleurochrysis_carterae.AAC.4